MIDQFKNEYQFLCNFFPNHIQYKGKIFESSEAAYQSEKCPGSEHLFVGITANESKKLGKKLKLRLDWDQVKNGIMEEILRIKFAPGTPLAQKLLNTGDEELVEEISWQDVYWGVCNGVGQNHLGKLLMKIRSELH